MYKEKTKEEKERYLDWEELMLAVLTTKEKLKDELECYYDLIQTNQKVIYMLSKGLLSKPNYVFKTYEDFFQERLDEAFEKGYKQGLRENEEKHGGKQ